MTTFYVTTGVSLSKSSRCWKDLRAWRGVPTSELLNEDDSGNIFRTIQSTRDKVLRAVSDERSAMAQVEESFDPLCWDVKARHTLPAELATLSLMHAEKLIATQDRVVFLMGQSNMRETLLLRAIYQWLGNGRVNTVMPKDVHVEGPYHWDPITTTDFQVGMGALWTSVCDTGGSFVLTGGFKAVLIDLTLKLSQAKRTTEIYYLHEEADDLVILRMREGDIVAARRVTLTSF